MLIWDNPAEIGRWMESKGAGRFAPGTFSAIGYVRGGKLVGGIAFTDSNGQNCQASIALEGGVFPPALLKAGLFYLFAQLTLRRVTFIISHANIRSQNLVVRLGARREATLHEADVDGGDLLVYALFPENCHIWSRLNGKISRRAAKPRSSGNDPLARARKPENFRLPASGDADEHAGSAGFADMVPYPAV